LDWAILLLMLLMLLMLMLMLMLLPSTQTMMVSFEQNSQALCIPTGLCIPPGADSTHLLRPLPADERHSAHSPRVHTTMYAVMIDARNA
jgi:hypothetical protein